MWTKKDSLIFLAGATTFHALSHLLLQFTNLLPITFYGITLTYQLNLWTVVISAVISAGLLWWASRVE